MSDQSANPLIAPLLALLQQATGSYKVHELMGALRQQGAIPQLADDEQLQLFRLNFLIMNALYQLQAELYEEGWWLVISTLDIRLEPLGAAADTGSTLARGEALRSYYLDWQVFWQTDRAEVEELLASFWRSYEGEEHKGDALALFGLDEGASQEAIRRRWRELALRHHPDRGGDAEAFIRIRWAWEYLRE
ncbi:DNA-J related domain-containing protein [Aeromonas sp. MdU4]|uniref:DNA-J related domain-containing protein n=1 Tax=Aeromonas sp. MdU4 TaxID=3342819 RepID=UPI0035BB76F3